MQKKNHVPSYPPLFDEYCITTALQTHTGRLKEKQPAIKTRCIKRNLDKVYNRENPWNKLEGYYYDTYTSEKAIQHITTMDKLCHYKSIDLGKASVDYIVKTKRFITTLWTPGINMTKSVVSGDVNYTKLWDKKENAFKVWEKLYKFWFDESK